VEPAAGPVSHGPHRPHVAAGAGDGNPHGRPGAGRAADVAAGAGLRPGGGGPGADHPGAGRARPRGGRQRPAAVSAGPGEQDSLPRSRIAHPVCDPAPPGSDLPVQHLLLLFAAHFLNDAALSVLPPLLPLLVEGRGLSVPLAASLVSIQSIVSGLAQPALGHVADVVRRPWLLPAVLLLCRAGT